MLCLALCFSHYSNAQEEYTTGNIVIPTVAGSNASNWVGGVYQDNLTCMASGQPGYCGPLAIVRPGGLINFSYGSTYLYQEQLLSNLLPNSGTGLQINGYTFSFTAKNGNSWDDGRTDQLTALVRFWDTTTSKGTDNLIYGTSYNLSYQFPWTNFNYSHTFTSPLPTTSVGRVQYGFIGRDNNGWAGPYGPEINSVNFNIRYSVDQCVTNPLYSTSCSGYAQAYLNQQCSLNPLYDQTCTGYAQAYFNQQCSLSALYDSGCPGYAQAYYTQQCTINPLYDSGCPGYAQAYFNQQCNLNALYNTQCPGYAQAKILKDQQEQQTSAETFAVPTPSITKIETSSSTVALADPTKTEAVVTTDVGGVELTVTGQVSIPTGQTTATKEAIKESASVIEKKEEKKTVNPRHLQLAQAAAKEAERTALSTASEAVAISQSETATSSALGFGPGINVQQRASGTTESESQTSTVTQNRTQTNPLQNATNLAPQGQEQNQKNGPAVRNGGKVDGMEGGPDPAQLAKAPMDFNQYLQSQLLDSQFYTTKEIYKSQRTVDNARAERFLNGKSDAIHQLMIEQQYNIGN